MLWDLSVHNTSLPCDSVRGLDKSEMVMCLRSPVSRNRNQKLPCSFSFFFLQRFNLKMSPNTTFDTSSTPTPVNSMFIIFMFLFFSARGILRVQFDCGNFFFFLFFFFFFFVSCSNICTRFPHWLDVITNGYCISIQSYERTALPYTFPDC